MCSFYLHQIMSIEDVERIMDETKEGIEYQRVGSWHIGKDFFEIVYFPEANNPYSRNLIMTNYIMYSVSKEVSKNVLWSRVQTHYKQLNISRWTILNNQLSWTASCHECPENNSTVYYNNIIIQFNSIQFNLFQ